jgi:hypothetical protein
MVDLMSKDEEKLAWQGFEDRGMYGDNCGHFNIYQNSKAGKTLFRESFKIYSLSSLILMN